MEQEKQTVKTQNGAKAMPQNKQSQTKVPPKAPPKPMPKVPPKPTNVATSNEINEKKEIIDKKLVTPEKKVEEVKSGVVTAATEKDKPLDKKPAQSQKDETKKENINNIPTNAPKRIKKPNETFYKTIRIIGDVLFIPFFIIVLFSTILMFSAKMRNEVPSLFGYSAVKILTPSMVDGEGDEYQPGDVVLVRACNPEDLEVGDIIAFYEPIVEVDEGHLETAQITSMHANISTTFLSFFGGGASNEYQRDAAQNYSRVMFHRIVAISTPSNPADEYYGKLFFQTQGDANNSPDAEWVMEDYIVGVYVNTNSFVGNLFQFCTTTAGMILLIILPSLIIIALLAIDIYGQSRQLRYEKQFEQDTVKMQEQILKEVTVSSKKKEVNDKENKQLEKKKEEILKDILSEADSVSKKSEKKENLAKPTDKIETTTVNKDGETKPSEQPKPKVEPAKPDIKNAEPKKPEVKTEPKKPNIKNEGK